MVLAKYDGRKIEAVFQCSSKDIRPMPNTASFGVGEDSDQSHI